MKTFTQSFNSFRLTGLVLLVAATASAQATLQYFDPADIGLTSTAPLIYLNVTTGEHNTFEIDDWSIEIYKSGGPAGNLHFAAPMGGGYVGASLNSPLNLDPGYEIGPTLANGYGYYGGGGLGAAFHQSNTELAGFKFLNPTTGVTNYGWIEVTTTSGNGYPAKITRWAYDDSGASVFAGKTQAVPEPTTLAALGLGTFGLLRRRRRG